MEITGSHFLDYVYDYQKSRREGFVDEVRAVSRSGQYRGPGSIGVRAVSGSGQHLGPGSIWMGYPGSLSVDDIATARKRKGAIDPGSRNAPVPRHFLGSLRR